MAAEANMREVVERLRAEGSEALLELLEFDSAIETFLQELQRIAPTFRDLHLVASKVVDLRNGEPLAWIAVREQTKHLSTWVDQFLVAFRELRGAVHGWNIAGAVAGSVLPSSGKRSIPQD